MIEAGAICGGQHLSKEWTKKEIIEHLKNEPCLDCYCNIDFKRKNGN